MFSIYFVTFVYFVVKKDFDLVCFKN
jgi:hypothetical protein